MSCLAAFTFVLLKLKIIIKIIKINLYHYPTQSICRHFNKSHLLHRLNPCLASSRWQTAPQSLFHLGFHQILTKIGVSKEGCQALGIFENSGNELVEEIPHQVSISVFVKA